MIRPALPQETGEIRTVQARSLRATYQNDQHGVTAEWVASLTDSWRHSLDLVDLEAMEDER